MARKFVQFSARLGKANRPEGQTTAQYVRVQLDRLGLGSDLTHIALGKQVTLQLPPAQQSSVTRVGPVDDSMSPAG